MAGFEKSWSIYTGNDFSPKQPEPIGRSSTVSGGSEYRNWHAG